MRITVTINDPAIIAEIENMASMEQRTIAAVGAILITRSVKDRIRKKKSNVKEDHIEHNASN